MTRDDLTLALDVLEQRLARMIAEKSYEQTKWITAVAAGTIVVLLAASAVLLSVALAFWFSRTFRADGGRFGVG